MAVMRWPGCQYDGSLPSAITPMVQQPVIEFQVNTWTTGAQSYPAVAMDATGDFVVAWASGGGQEVGTGLTTASTLSAIMLMAPRCKWTEFHVNTYTD